MVKAYVALGSNIGDRIQSIKKALDMLKSNKKIKVLKVSSLYETEPVEYPDQEWFINLVAEIETELTPEELLIAGIEIERTLERQETIRWGPRTIDIDILTYGQELISTSVLQIPHLRMHARAFILIPLQEIAGDFRHPVLNKTPAQMFDQLNEPTKVTRIEEAGVLTV